MGEKFKTPSAIIVLITKKCGNKTQVLCQKRCNTGFADGLYDFSYSGKVDKGECMTAAAVREAKEELTITVKPEDLKFMMLVHKYDAEFDVTFINTYFICETYQGEIKIGEPDKCSCIDWFDIDDLPEDLLDDRREALYKYLAGERFIEYGWQK